MNDDAIRLVTIGRIFRRRWRLLAIVAVVGALVGHGASLVFPPRYTTSASVLLPGTWEERELLTQTEVATSSVVVDRAAATLGWSGVSGSDLRDQVSAKATDGNIIKISGTADTPERAQRLSDQVAKEFVSYATRIANDSADPEAAGELAALQKSVKDTSRRISKLADAADPGQTVESVQTRTELEKLRTALREAINTLEQADPTEDEAKNMVVMGSAARPTGEAPPTRTQLIAGGALLFFLFAVIGHLTAARMSRRLRGEGEITAALGSALLGAVDVPVERPMHRPQGRGPRAWIRRLLGLDVRWDLPTPRTSGDEASRQIRYRRVCSRLRDQPPAPRRLLVVFPEGDEIARLAAGQLVVEAGSVPSPSSSSRGYPMLRAVAVSVSRPMVPDRGYESGALVVLSPGSWTAAELAGIAEACADAKHAVVGIVLAGPVRATRSDDHSRHAAVPAPAGLDGELDDARGVTR
ncbi:Wzz/FepE/Etk N-terminal domain-containing protein [Streptomyces griseus]|uniref:Wzz/FepE/Etk N-terminal domain-containing protein n=1 Tax=Streptomyces griseus TaxID=1911 RepID=UPI00055CF0AC|nr:Wzz/FepE/Etk N-terminal domain-containing protein [Streptomyces griseus]